MNKRMKAFAAGLVFAGLTAFSAHAAEPPYLPFVWQSGDACLTPARKHVFLQGAEKWAFYGKIAEDPAAKGSLGTFDPGPASNTVAIFYESLSEAGDRPLFWKININWRKTVTGTDTAHEFGHAFGLNDLYTSFHSDQIMYGYSSGTVKVPALTDIKCHSYNAGGVCVDCGGLKK